MLKTHYEDIATFFSNPWNIVGVVCLLPFFVLRSIAKVEVINGIGKFHARLSGKREKA
jgi:hypothetical protein